MHTSLIETAVTPHLPVEAAAGPRPRAEVKPTQVEVEQRVDKRELAKIQHALAQHDISLKFSKDEMTNNLVVQMIDEKTGEAIRQFPTEVSLSLAANFLKLQGVFIDVEK